MKTVKNRLLYTIGLMMLGIFMFSGSLAHAASAAGPYYAIPSWDQQHPASTRFIVLTSWGNAAVLDRETGLVWEQSPSTVTLLFADAQYHCNTLTTGGRLGWRLPSIQELSSLVDPTQSNPALPSGHPFTVTSNAQFWSATNAAFNPASYAWIVRFFDGGLGVGEKSTTGPDTWCVRGGSGTDSQ